MTLCHCVLEICELSFDFIVGNSEEIAVSLRRNSGLLNSDKTVIDYEDYRDF